MNILFTSVAISQLKCLDYAFFVAKMSKMTFTRFGGQVWLNSGQVRQFRGRATLRCNRQKSKSATKASLVGILTCEKWAWVSKSHSWKGIHISAKLMRAYNFSSPLQESAVRQLKAF